MTAAEALRAGYFRLHGTSKALNSEKGETVELFTDLEAKMITTLEEIHEILKPKNMEFTNNAIAKLIAEVRGEK